MEWESSVFRYKKKEFPNKNHPLQNCCSYGNYYKNARKRSQRNNVENNVGNDVGEDEEGLEHKCLIMAYEYEDAIAQIKLSKEIGDGYALNVLHIDDTNELESKVKVFYPYFEDTVFGWLEKLVENNANKESHNCGPMSEEQILQKASEINKGLKDKVIPMTRKLWKLLGEMKEKGMEIRGTELEAKQIHDQGYWMPLINNKVPMVLNLQKGGGILDPNYPVTIIERVLSDVYQINICSQKEGQSLHMWLKKALKFWKDRRPTLSLYDAGKHPALYDSAEKSKFLSLFINCAVDYGLQPWLNRVMTWSNFHQGFKGTKFKNVYEKILNYQNFDRCTPGGDIVMYTKNTLVHFEETYKSIYGKPWDGGEIVEIVDEDLAVCSLFYACARTIIEKDQPPKFIKQENWNEAKKKLKDFLGSLK